MAEEPTGAEVVIISVVTIIIGSILVSFDVPVLLAVLIGGAISMVVLSSLSGESRRNSGRTSRNSVAKGLSKFLDKPLSSYLPEGEKYHGGFLLVNSKDSSEAGYTLAVLSDRGIYFIKKENPDRIWETIEYKYLKGFKFPTKKGSMIFQTQQKEYRFRCKKHSGDIKSKAKFLRSKIGSNDFSPDGISSIAGPNVHSKIERGNLETLSQNNSKKDIESLSKSELLAVLQEIDPYEFEYLIADLWELQGWNTSVTSGARDEGIDVVATKSSPRQKQILQVKRYSQTTIGSSEVRTYETLRRQEPDADSIWIITTSGFTSEARSLGKKLNVKLVDGSALCDYINELDAYDLIYQYSPYNWGNQF